MQKVITVLTESEFPESATLVLSEMVELIRYRSIEELLDDDWILVAPPAQCNKYNTPIFKWWFRKTF